MTRGLSASHLTSPLSSSVLAAAGTSGAGEVAQRCGPGRSSGRVQCFWMGLAMFPALLASTSSTFLSCFVYPGNERVQRPERIPNLPDMWMANTGLALRREEMH